MLSFISDPAPCSPPLQLSRNEAQARTTIAQRVVAQPLHFGGTDWLASLRPVIQPDWPVAADDCIADVEWAGAQLQLQLPVATIEQLLSALLDGAALPQIPDALQSVALSAALDEFLSGLERLGRGVPKLSMPTTEQPSAVLPHAISWQLQAPQGTQALRGQLRTDSLGLLLIAGLAAGLPPQDGLLASFTLPLQLRLDIGYASLTLEELQSLALADVLLLERNFLTGERVLWLQAPGAGGLHVQLPGAPDAGADPAPAAAPFLSIVQSWTHAMPAFDPPSSEAASFDAIPLRLSFDLGEISLTLAELRALQPGQTIALAHPVAGAVRIRANGVLIGEGELVDIEGQLGVSVQQLFSSSAKPAA